MDRQFAFVRSGKVEEIVPYILDIGGTQVSLENRIHSDILKLYFIEIPEGLPVEEGWYYQQGMFRRPNADGSAPVPVDIDTVVPRYDTSTLEGLREAKLAEINAACERTITAGVELETSQGIERFALTPNDQINIAFYEQQISAGASHVPYHADGKLCRMFAAAEITAVATAAAQWKVYHTTYCNHLRDHVKGLEVAEEIAAVTYGMELPDELKASFDAIIAALGGAGDETPD